MNNNEYKKFAIKVLKFENIMSFNRNYRTLTVENSYLVEAAFLVLIYTVCFAKLL